MKKHTLSWTKEQFQLHQESANVLIAIKDQLFALIFSHPTITEYELQQFVIEQFKANDQLGDKDPPIVAFGSNTSFVHYFPEEKSSAALQPNDPILIDIWCKSRNGIAPFADITWMGYNGKPDPLFAKIYNIVIEARENAVSLLKAELKKGNIPTGQQIDLACRNLIEKAGYGSQFMHTTGHSLGNTSPHGIWGALRRTNAEPIHLNMGYTIEPGIYLDGKFGARSEINFLVDSDLKLYITTAEQSELVSP